MSDLAALLGPDDGPPVTEEQYNAIMAEAFRKAPPKYDFKAIIKIQIDFLNAGASVSFTKVPLVGPDNSDLGCARYNFSKKTWVWAHH